MDGETLYSIGDLARRTGLTVKAIRFYSDRGIVPPAGRSPAGYRRYGIDAVARLALVRTLRDLGLDLATICRVVDREVTLPEIAAAHAEALVVQIRLLRRRHAVLTTVAGRGHITPEELDLVHKLVTLSEDERRRLIDGFLDTVFGGLDTAPEVSGIARSMTPELSATPDTEQIGAWVELAELSQDPEFRAGMRRVAEDYAIRRAHLDAPVPRRDPAAVIRDEVAPALAAGVDPVSPDADPIVVAVMAHCAEVFGPVGPADIRQWLLVWLESANDPRRERYLQLLAVVNGWSAPDSLTPAFDWFTRALHARKPQ